MAARVVTLSTCFLVLESTAYCLLFAAHSRKHPPGPPHWFLDRGASAGTARLTGCLSQRSSVDCASSGSWIGQWSHFLLGDTFRSCSFGAYQHPVLHWQLVDGSFRDLCRYRHLMLCCHCSELHLAAWEASAAPVWLLPDWRCHRHYIECCGPGSGTGETLWCFFHAACHTACYYWRAFATAATESILANFLRNLTPVTSTFSDAEHFPSLYFTNYCVSYGCFTILQRLASFGLRFGWHSCSSTTTVS